MKFRLERASNWKDLGIIKINSLDELKLLNSKYNNKEDFAWSDSQKIVVDFGNIYEEDKEHGINGVITIYDYYIE